MKTKLIIFTIILLIMLLLLINALSNETLRTTFISLGLFNPSSEGLVSFMKIIFGLSLMVIISTTLVLINIIVSLFKRK